MRGFTLLRMSSTTKKEQVKNILTCCIEMVACVRAQQQQPQPQLSWPRPKCDPSQKCLPSESRKQPRDSMLWLSCFFDLSRPLLWLRAPHCRWIIEEKKGKTKSLQIYLSIFQLVRILRIILLNFNYIRHIFQYIFYETFNSNIET